MKSKKFLFALALLVVVTVPALATNWSLAGDFSSTTQGNNGWYYGTDYYLTYSQAAAMATNGSCTSFVGDQYFGHFSPAVDLWMLDAGVALFYSPQATSMYQYYNAGPWASGGIGAGKVAIMTSGATDHNVKARWVASIEGDYTYNVTFTDQTNSLNGVSVNWGDQNANTKIQLGAKTYITDAVSTQTYTGTQHLLAGQYLEFVVDPHDANGNMHYIDNADKRFDVIGVDATITDVPAPEPGSLMAMATGLVGLVGFGIRRRKA
jgi:hypothetical protein